ncbi:hypothetical protein DBIPINDM_001406 [Mesorhizobium sp. AR02]|uniref:hypothetical protein n=1 Tax=Mesorhizobium sp. AR02 TaxID=2865837 RepID=UPI0021602F4D|nr:hypothetical protein [Mesorhizobium sp. AR02]UVK54926.1 hypothetical protein DBIPINDM_001406 [Mesorhizobium sp. AR02]
MKAKMKQADQSAEFIRVAREIGADEDKSAADALLGKLAHMPPAPKPKSKTKGKAKAKRPAK